jgi:dihydrodipicolinate synthase/N-acetylneuraminate lyase
MLRPRRRIIGMSAILLPFKVNGEIDWAGFDAHVTRTARAGLTPAVNMDTGFANLIDEQTRATVLQRTRSILAGDPFVAGAFVADAPGAAFDADAYRRQIDAIQPLGGLPILFQSYGLTEQTDDQIIASYVALGRDCPRYLAFELGTMFAPFGEIYTLDTYRALLGIPQCIGAKHSSLDRTLEWERLQARDAVRPDFLVLTGNDLAIDMVMYGSDYLLGLSTFAPDAFALRDSAWQSGDPDFYALNDLLQYLGFLAFRPPVPAYRHSAAQFLRLRGWIDCDRTHPRSPQRPDSDLPLLADVAARLHSLIG